MPTIIEVGHAKNVANFRALILICSQLGSQYDPSNGDYSLDSLNAIYKDADAAVKAVDAARGQYIQAIKPRQANFKGLGSLCTRIVKSLNLLRIDAGVVEAIKGVNRKIQGQKRSGNKPANDVFEDTVVVNTENANETTVPVVDTESSKISSAQLSYDSKLANFRRMIELLSAEPKYTPNEKQLQVANLNDYYNQLENANIVAFSTGLQLIDARAKRNDILYNNPNNLYRLAFDIKDYLLSAIGSNSPIYKQARKLRFSSGR